MGQQTTPNYPYPTVKQTNNWFKRKSVENSVISSEKTGPIRRSLIINYFQFYLIIYQSQWSTGFLFTGEGGYSTPRPTVVYLWSAQPSWIVVLAFGKINGVEPSNPTLGRRGRHECGSISSQNFEFLCWFKTNNRAFWSIPSHSLNNFIESGCWVS